MNQPLDFESGAKFARYSYLLGYIVAQQNERPAWNTSDFFGEHYGKKANCFGSNLPTDLQPSSLSVANGTAELIRMARSNKVSWIPLRGLRLN
jgi:hypothetical protein